MEDGIGLQIRLQGILPGARLEITSLPDCSDVRLFLLGADYSRGRLDAEVVRRVMNHPLYWVFCWASGQVLARHLLRHPDLVRGTRVVDFGCGSGVVAIAAALAGAGEVIACDSDPRRWTVEAAIPLQAIVPAPPGKGQTWAAGIVRTMPAEGVQSWTHPTGSVPRPVTFGLVRFD